ncbi:FtsX-like permease family protein [Clostridium aestuarii]|uniref:FtsX-like permease family protein n=1 Tax=Clostridium aestuarii TaxID=338193 RepID=A0ABT4D290_9CLOT|nr:FtsX-like permease family protein [Clostridium aestuarii]MCY6484148.1 FtsX-like permease family protein [Clostridium aestuarii]
MTFEKIVLNNVFRNLRVHIGYLLSSIFSLATFFILSMIYYHPFLEGSYLKDIFLFFREIIYIITIFFVMYFLKMFIKSKKKDFGIFLILGMNKKQIRKILFIENMVIGVLSIIIGIIFGVVFLKFFIVIISNILEIEELKLYFSMRVILKTVFRYLILFCMIPVFIGRTIKINNIIDLIDYKKEENLKLEVSLIKSVISIAVIIAGYILVFTSNINNILSIRLLIILMVFVLGNYLFFNYIVNYIIYLFSKIKKIYLNKMNFLFLSDLKYRVYDNITMLFIVTILLAVSFTSIGSAYIQKSVLKRDAVKNSPFSLNYLVNDYSNYAQDERFIDDILKANNLKYNKIELHVIQLNKEQNEKKQEINFIKQSEYNNAVSIIKRKMVNLKKGEVVLVPRYEDILQSEKNLIGKKLNSFEDDNFIIKSNVEGCITLKGVLQNTYILSNEEFDRIYDKYDKRLFIGYEIDNWEKIDKITKKIKYKYQKNDKNINDYLTFRVELYNSEKTINNILVYLIVFVGSILYLSAVSFMNYKFYIEIKQEQNKYDNMINLGLTFRELKKIISREMMVIFFVPYIIATIDAIFAYRILYIVYEIPILKSILQIVSIIFALNMIYFFIWTFKNISYLENN